MSQLGMMVMLHQINSSNEESRVIRDAAGKVIADLRLHDDALFVTMTDGYKMRIWDDGQSCCEDRYMHTDDDLSAFIGASFVGAELRTIEEMPGYEYHEVQFLLINTSLGTFTMANHNVHNGFYGGFAMRAEIVEGEQI